MNFERKFRRRAMLAGGSALGLLPWLEALPGGRLSVARAAAPAPIKRFMVFFWPGGVVRSQYWPSGSETNFTLPHILEPLTPHKDKILLLDGLDMPNMLEGAGHPHTRGMGGLLTGKIIGPGKYAFFLGGSTDFAQGPSIDHTIGNAIGADRRFKTLELGVLWPTYGSGPSPTNIISYSGAGQPAQPVSDPWQAFSRIFTGVGGDMGQTSAQQLRIKKTQLVLDSVSAEFRAVSGGMGVDDKARLDEHLGRLADIRASLDASVGGGAACKVPTTITEADRITYTTGGDGSHVTIAANASSRIPTIGKQMMDMAVMAFACDLTRVVSLQFTDAASRASFPWMNLNENHHFYQHDGGYQQQPCIDIARFYVEQFAYLLQRMAEVKEGDLSLLDTTAILMCSEIGDPPSHDHKRIPFIIAGNGGGSFRTGRYLKFNSQPHHNLLVALLNSYGINQTTVGEAKFNTGALTGLG
jgi:hypothetical protein